MSDPARRSQRGSRAPSKPGPSCRGRGTRPPRPAPRVRRSEAYLRGPVRFVYSVRVARFIHAGDHGDVQVQIAFAGGHATLECGVRAMTLRVAPTRLQAGAERLRRIAGDLALVSAIVSTSASRYQRTQLRGVAKSRCALAFRLLRPVASTLLPDDHVVAGTSRRAEVIGKRARSISQPPRAANDAQTCPMRPVADLREIAASRSVRSTAGSYRGNAASKRPATTVAGARLQIRSRSASVGRAFPASRHGVSAAAGPSASKSSSTFLVMSGFRPMMRDLHEFSFPVFGGLEWKHGVPPGACLPRVL